MISRIGGSPADPDNRSDLHAPRRGLPEVAVGPVQSAAYWATLVGILGTTISPYLFFWQAAPGPADR